MRTRAAAIFHRRIAKALKESAAAVQEEARQNHKFTTRTAQFERSVETRIRGTAYAEVFLDTNVAKYAPFVHQGTKPHTIAPKEKKALRWVAGGRFVFAKWAHHPGTAADPFLYAALDNKQGEIKRIFEKYTDDALDEVARDVERKRYYWRR
ncbi:MAG: hypothetical protein E6672_07125 [Negativicoccus succinicivorans]|nr:hypothetical protein [Negativicoccus succinicivorans]